MPTYRDVFNKALKIATSLNVPPNIYRELNTPYLKQGEKHFEKYKRTYNIFFPLSFVESLLILQVAEGFSSTAFLSQSMNCLREAGILNSLLAMNLIFWEWGKDTTVIASMSREASQRRSRALRKLQKKARKKGVDKLQLEYIVGHLTGYPLLRLDLHIQRRESFTKKYYSDVDFFLSSIVKTYTQNQLVFLAREVKLHLRKRQQSRRYYHGNRSKVLRNEKSRVTGTLR